MIDDAEKRLRGCVAELEKVKANYQVSIMFKIFHLELYLTL